jgi:ubiquinone biosynthesis protein
LTGAALLSAPVHLVRLARVGFVLAREGALGLVDAAMIPPPVLPFLRLGRLIERRNVTGSRIAAAFTRLGPSYIKFGQFLATRPDIVGIAVARELETLQDRLPPFPRADAVKVIEAESGRPIDEVFASFSEPVAAASIAQVHKATVRTAAGERIMAVKVLRPGIRARFLGDLDTMRFIARWVERLVPEISRLRPLEVVETLARSVAMEMDLRLEAAALSELAENTREDADFRVPTVDWERTMRDVLTIAWIDGIPLSDIPALQAAGHDRVALARIVIQSFLRHAMRDGFFHADMHQGNLFIDAEGRLVAVDCGIMGRLGPKERRFLAEILYGFITRAYRRVAEVHFEAGYVPAHHSVDDFALAIRAIGEPIHDRRADEISMAHLLTLLFEITALFDMRTRTELVMLQKTMIVVEGVGRSLDPKLDMWSTAEPVVRSWIERNLGPVGKLEDVAAGARETGHFLGELPALLNRGAAIAEALQVAARRGFVVAPESVEAIGRAEGRGNRWLAAGIWAVAALLLVMLLRS